MDDSYIKALKAGLEACVSAAVAEGMGVSFTPHLDDSAASSVTKWRNRLMLDPYLKYLGEGRSRGGVGGGRWGRVWVGVGGGGEIGCVCGGGGGGSVDV